MTLLSAKDLQDQLLTLDTVRERLSVLEPLSSFDFALDGSSVTFDYPDGWNVGLKELPGTQTTSARVALNGHEYVLTKDAALEVTSLIGLTKDYVSKTPGSLVTTHLNYWMSHMPNRELKLLARDDTGHAFTKASIVPFSNLLLLDRAEAALREKYGHDTQILADYKFHHDLRSTYIRLIVPEYEKHISSARADGTDDVWSTGVQITNSIIGEKPLSLRGFLFAWWCTNGAISTHASSGNYNRRVQGQSDDVYDWAREAVDEILGGLEHELDAVEELTTISVEQDVNQVLTDIFQTYRVPLESRESIIAHMVETDDLTMYGVMNAVTQAANATNISEVMRNTLMEVGGDLPRAMTSRCAACHRLPI